MAPPPEPPSSITLRIKVPPGHIPGGADEFRLGDDIAVSLKIGQIRERIQEAIPSSPTPERQRLLYGGRALVDNEQTLADALNMKRDPTQNEYVVHLLVKGDGANSAPVPHVRSTTSTRSTTPGASGVPQQQGQTQIPTPQQPHHAHPNQTLEQLQATAFAQQQQLHQQLVQNLNRQRFGGQGVGMTPFGMQPMNFGGHMPAMQPHGHGPPMPIPGHHHTPPPANPANMPAPPESTPASLSPAPGQPQQANTQPGSEQPQSQTNNSQSQQPPRRPISNQGFHMEGMGPNGERITIHQHTLNIPYAGFAGQHMPPGGHVPQMHQMPLGLPPLQDFQMPNFPRPNGPSALDRARANVAEMRRMLDELRDSSETSEAQRQRISELETRTQNLNDYIDPFHLGNVGNNRPRSESPFAAGAGVMPGAQASGDALTTATNDANWQARARLLRDAQRQPAQTDSSEVTCYVLSSTTGPQAILYSPRHGAYTGSLQYQTHGLQPTPTVSVNGPTNTTTAPNGQDEAGQVAAQIQAAAQQQAQQQAPQDPLAMGAMFNHMWLLLRVLICAYFLLGANLGWRRPLALLAIGIGFWLIRTGLLGDGGAVRRWWEGIMNDGRPAAQNQGNNQANAEGEQGNQPAGAANGGPARMPTPEEVAQRILDEDARARNERFQGIRERIRPIERAVALLVASLWPGVGEQYVRAREQEERRRAEEEVAARRREEEERQRQEEEAKKQAEEKSVFDAKGSAETTEGEPSASTTDAQPRPTPPTANENSG